MNPAVAVVGPGAIGTTVAAALHEAGRTPMLCGRTARERLELRDAEGLVVVPGPVRIDPAQTEEAVDLVFLAVKSTQVDAAAPWLAALCRTGTVVCVLQNGVEQESAVAPYSPGCPVLPSVVWFPAQVQPGGSVWLRGEARLTMPDVPAARVVLEALRGTRCSVDLAADFTSVAWRKLLQNAAAGLMVLSGRRSGMFSRADIGQLSLDYLRECRVGHPQRCRTATRPCSWHPDAHQQCGGAPAGVRERRTRLIPSSAEVARAWQFGHTGGVINMRKGGNRPGR